MEVNSSNLAGKGRQFSFRKTEPDPLLLGLEALCAQFDRDLSSAELTDGLPIESGLLPLEYVPRALQRAGLDAKVTNISLESLSSRLLPALLLTKDGSSLLLMGWVGDQAQILIPEAQSGEQDMLLEELEELYVGTAVLAKPKYQPDGRAGDYARDSSEHWLKTPLKACWPAYAEVSVASLVANFLAVSTALFALQVYDRVVPNDAFDTLLVLATGVIVALILEFVLRVLRAYLLDVTGKRLDLLLSSRLFEQVVSIRLASKPGSTGAFSSQVREFESVREFFTSSTAATISDLPFVLMFLLLIAYIGGSVVWVPVAAIVLMLIPGLLLQGALGRLSRASLREGAVKQGLLLEVIDNLETVKATRAEGRKLRSWEELSEKLAEDGMRSRRLSSLLSYGAGTVQQLCYVGVIIVGVFEISAGNLTLGGLIACTILASRTIAPVNQATGILIRWQHVKVALEGLNALMSAPVEHPQGRHFAHKALLYGHYHIEGLQYRYDSESPVVLNIPKLDIQAGSRVILLGGIGAGKSTLLRLMSGLDESPEGRLLLDDVSLSQIDPVDRRRAIGYLPQDIALFYGTLRENLQLDGEHHTDDQLFEVLDAAGLGSAVRAHHMGLDMPIIGNSSVSGGQRQAIGLARLLLQDPKIVLMDEPTTAFDQASEAQLIRYLKNWLKGRTLIMSTHKRAMLVLGERGLVLQSGTITMDGALQEILGGGIVQAADAK